MLLSFYNKKRPGSRQECKKQNKKTTATHIVALCPYLCSKSYRDGAEYKNQIIKEYRQSI
jgi:hypothetical protein